MLKPTDQQIAIMDTAKSGANMVIEAGAGCGKTSTLQMIASHTGAQGLFVAFNRAVADDAQKKLQGTRTQARNTHRLAYAWAAGHPTASVVIKKLNSTSRANSSMIASRMNVGKLRLKKDFSLTGAAQVALARETLENFMRSGDEKITSRHFHSTVALEKNSQEYKDLRHKIVALAQRMWEDALNPESSIVKVTHDVYLKLWSMERPRLPYDLIMLDEAQDTNPAVKVVLDAQDHAQRIVVGDSAQQLFRWTGAVNIMGEFEGERRDLTKSWRFGRAIEDAANFYLDRLGARIRLQGNYDIPSRIASSEDFDSDASTAILTRTNASAIARVTELINAGQGVYLVGGTKSQQSLIRAIDQLRQGRTSSHPELLGFPDYKALTEYVDESSEGRDLGLLVKMIEDYGAESLLNTLDHCAEREAPDVTTISTVHKVKGREWDQVVLAEDFVPANSKTGDSDESLMVKYVAVTRAKKLLDPGPLKKELSTSPAPAPQPKKPESVSVSLPEDISQRLRSATGADLDVAIRIASDFFLKATNH